MQKNASGGQGLFVFLRAGAETPALWSAGRCLRMQTSAAGRHLRPALLRARPLVGGAVPSYAVFRGGAVPPSRAPSHPCLRSAGRHLRPALLRTRAFVRRGGASVCRLPRQGGAFAPRFFVPALWSAGRRVEGSGRCGFCNINTKNKKFFQNKY